MNPTTAQFDRLIIRAAAVADGAGLFAAPGVVLLEAATIHGFGPRSDTAHRQPQSRQPGHVDNLTAGGCRIIAAGSPQEVGAAAVTITTIDLPDAIIIPALVNAHAHLDLTHIGPQPEPVGGGFSAWAEMIRNRRAMDEQAIWESVQQGVELSIRGGTAVIGDIAGGRSLLPIQTLRASGLRGTSYLEVFGIGASQGRSAAFLRELIEHVASDADGVRLGVQPHAPYSCGLNLYQAAAGLNLPMATHLAETLEEIEFVQQATGPLADMLKRLGVWDDSITRSGNHPIDHLAPILREHPCLAAHLNYVDSRHLEAMLHWPISVAYCPRASAYFGHPQQGHVPHRYREMLQAGINVALGTDSVVCLPPEQADRLSVLDEMRFLYQRDATDPALLLRMATVNGARALGIDENLVTFKPGHCAGVIAVTIDGDDSRSPLERALGE